MNRRRRSMTVLPKTGLSVRTVQAAVAELLLHAKADLAKHLVLSNSKLSMLKAVMHSVERIGRYPPQGASCSDSRWAFGKDKCSRKGSRCLTKLMLTKQKSGTPNVKGGTLAKVEMFLRWQRRDHACSNPNRIS